MRGSAFHSVEQVAQPVGAVAPVVALGQLLGLGDDLLLAATWTRRRAGPLGLARLALARDHRAERVEPGRPGASRSPTALASVDLAAHAS